jgi:hypothetical protein
MTHVIPVSGLRKKYVDKKMHTLKYNIARYSTRLQLLLNKKSPARAGLAPLTDERCNYNAMIEYVTIRKLKG